MRTLLIDVDGVLANFETPAIQAIEEITGGKVSDARLRPWDLFADLTEDEGNRVWDRLTAPGMVEGLEPYPGARVLVCALREWGDLYCVTSAPPRAHWHVERLRWVERHLGLDHKHVIFTSAKHLVGGDVFIDDRPDTVVRWSRAHPAGLAIVYGVSGPSIWSGVRASGPEEVLSLVAWYLGADRGSRS